MRMLHFSEDFSRRDWLKAVQASCWAFAGIGSAANAAYPGTTPIPRLVTVGGGITEVVYRLGAEYQLVGTDSTSVFPAAAEKTPKVGYMRQLSAEGVLSLRPDMLITTSEAGPPAVVSQLQSAGVRVWQIPATHTWEELRQKIELVGKAVQREKQAELLWQDVVRRKTLIEQRIPQDAERRAPRVLFVLAHGGSPMASGKDTAAAAMMAYSGARNAMTSYSGYRPLTPEAVAAVAPDYLLTTTQGVQTLGGIKSFLDRPEWRLLPKLRESQAVLHFDALELLGFGPRMPHMIEKLQKAWGWA